LTIVLSVLVWFTDFDYLPLVSSSSSYSFFLLDFWTISIVLNLLGFIFFHFIRSEYISLLCALGLYNYFTAILSLFYMQFLSWAIYTLFVRFFYWTKNPTKYNFPIWWSPVMFETTNSKTHGSMHFVETTKIGANE
jgi:hypothetical protein